VSSKARQVPDLLRYSDGTPAVWRLRGLVPPHVALRRLVQLIFFFFFKSKRGSLTRAKWETNY
jgi:hypothetical protein